MAAKRKGTSPTRDLMVAIPEDVYKALKLHCTVQEVYAKDVVTEALRRLLKLEKKEE
jgi:predicted metal-dependent RNase